MEDQYSLVSMTGYGRATAETDELSIVVELRSVNHRFLEVVSKLPHGLMGLEEEIKKKVGQWVKRGRVDTFVQLEWKKTPQRKVEVDWDLVHGFMEHSKQLESKLGIKAEFTVSDFIHKPEFWIIHEHKWDTDHISIPLSQALEGACETLNRMRKQEGSYLAQDLEQRLKNMEDIIQQMEKKVPLARKQLEQRFRLRIEQLLDDVNYEQEKLLTEVAILAEKADISEELIRIRSHLIQFKKSMGMQEPMGRKLDFLLQEFHRELNTIGAKSHFTELNTLVVEAKSEIEKMKEQVQNIE
ncbi:YicC family protein [Hazenella sp. IB182353]|uniref:YicC/YloC family endoribonuclease n=1 Tax=Polycladospora coralii TaxID=2771432 RepID=UPI00174682F3|nr:YicC/YloC family endoribonuclease [Polycladospora coralii]MBS7530336.1 YicC family protein [Polycladospora coralii]